MPKQRDQDERRNGAPEVVAPTTRVTVAFPFSHIAVHEPDDRVAALAVLVEDLAAAVAELAPGERAEALVRRARDCVVALRS